MKGINVKKIAAFAGAAVLASACLGAAEVVFGSTQLVDNNGQPTVKVYVGSKAAVSDGVAAANIAAKIANEAYKSSTLTASTSGTATCTAGTGATGAGACSIVESSKKVTLSVEIPGTVAGTHTFKTLIGDYIDKQLQNRNNTRSEDNFSALRSSGDTSGSVTSPLRLYSENNIVAKHLYRIGSDRFNGFADYAVSDAQATAMSYTEEQAFWVGASDSTSPTVKYDTSTDVKDIVVDKYKALVYNLKFTGNDYGIPICTGDLASNDTSNWASCTSDSNSRTDRHRVGIKFLGGDWIISEMTNPTTALASATNVTNGGQIKLAKEAKYGIINVGGELDAGTYKVRLSDISVATGSDNKHPAIVDILDSNEAVVGQVQVDPGTTYTFNNGGSVVKIHVYKTAPGFTLNAKWAEMAIYTDEVTLKDTGVYNLGSTSSENPDRYFKVSLMWKNKDWASASDSSVPDALREVVVYKTDDFSKAKPGDVQNFLKSTPTFKLTYQGLDLTDSDYQQVTYTAVSWGAERVSVTEGADGACTSDSADNHWTAKLVEIASGGSLLLSGSGDVLGVDYKLDKVYFDPVGLNATNGTVPNGAQNRSAYSGGYSPKVFWKASNKDCYNWKTVAYSTNPASTASIKFDTAGDNTAAQGRFFFDSTVSLSGSQGSIVLAEDAGYYGLTSNNQVLVAVPFIVNVNYTGIRFRNQDSSTQQTYYKGLADASYGTYEPTYVTERGSKVTNVGTSDAELKVAKKVGMPTFQFAYADTTSASNTDDYVMGVGDSKVFGGVTVKVKAIDATAGSCNVVGTGGVPACTPDQTGVTAMIQPNNAASVEVTEPYKLSSKMVMMETDATSAGVAILVGGPEVNMMTKDALKDSSVDFNTQPVVVKEIGNKIVVAGKSASDTLSAADEFIAGVKRQ